MPPRKQPVDIEMCKRFALVRKSLKLNQGQLAVELGVDRTYVVLIENGTREVPMLAVKKLLLKFNVSPAYIIAGVDEIEYKSPGSSNTFSGRVKEMELDIEILKAEVIKLKKALTP